MKDGRYLAFFYIELTVLYRDIDTYYISYIYSTLILETYFCMHDFLIVFSEESGEAPVERGEPVKLSDKDDTW